MSADTITDRVESWTIETPDGTYTNTAVTLANKELWYRKVYSYEEY